MDYLEKTLLSKASSEHRFDPKQQKEFLGTFRERVVFAAKPSQVTAELIEKLPQYFSECQTEYPSLSLKISAELRLSTQMTLMKIADQVKLASTIVQESDSQSPYALVLHSNQALNIENIEPALPSSSDKEKIKRASFWSKMWRNHDKS